MSNFQRTIDLRESKNSPRPVSSRRSASIEKIYQSEPAEAAVNLKKIDQPKRKVLPAGDDSGWRFSRLSILILAVIVVSATIYLLFFKNQGSGKNPKAQNWYAVKLINGEVFYGQVTDAKADPLVINKVYYNYDQAKQIGAAKEQAKTIEESGNIRLVKRGQETHGPDGSLNVVRSQVLYLEPMKSDSKVLKAILEYEK